MSRLSPHHRLRLDENFDGYGTPAGDLLGKVQCGFAIDWRAKSMVSRVRSHDPTNKAWKNLVGDPQEFLTYSAPSVKMTFDKSGILAERTAGNIPYQHWPIHGGACAGAFWEDASTEKVTRSWELTHAAWTANNLGGGALGTGDTSPMGSGAASGKTNYYRMDTDGASANHSIEIPITLAANTYVMLMCFCKPQELTNISLVLRGTANNYAAFTFNLSAGTVDKSFGSTSGDMYANALRGVVEFKSGEYICYACCRINEANPTVVAQLVDSATPTYSSQGMVTFAGTSGDGVDIFLVGAQTQPYCMNTPILTDGSEVTRAVDNIVFPVSKGGAQDIDNHYRQRYGDVWGFSIPYFLGPHSSAVNALDWGNGGQRHDIVNVAANDNRTRLRSRNNNGDVAYPYDSGYHNLKDDAYNITLGTAQEIYCMAIKGAPNVSFCRNMDYLRNAEITEMQNTKDTQIAYDTGRSSDGDVPVASQLGVDTAFVYYAEHKLFGDVHDLVFTMKRAQYAER